MRRARRAFLVSSLLAAGLLGCELIVSSTVPDFHCTPGDPSSCPSGQACDPQTLACTTGEIAEAGPGLDARVDAPDTGAGTDTSLGAHCETTTPCADGLLCGTANILTTSIVKGSDAVCTKACCVSEDCGDGFVCFNAGTGGSYCVSTARAQRETLGSKKPGATCDSNTQCRSGVCADGRCQDTCCSDGECATGTVYRVKSISTPPPAREGWICAEPEANAGLANASGCSGSLSTCFNDNCSGFPQKCRPSCCNNADCVDAGNHLGVCAYGSFVTTQTVAKWCFDVPDGGAALGADLGASCQGNNDCKSRFCDPDTKVCGTVCCEDKDCAQDERCLPSQSGTPYLRCVSTR